MKKHAFNITPKILVLFIFLLSCCSEEPKMPEFGGVEIEGWGSCKCEEVMEGDKLLRVEVYFYDKTKRLIDRWVCYPGPEVRGKLIEEAECELVGSDIEKYFRGHWNPDSHQGFTSLCGSIFFVYYRNS